MINAVISHKHKVIFVHVPKCGGQSVETLFLSDLGLGWDDRDALNLRKNPNRTVGPERIAHLTLPEYLELHYANLEQLEGYFVFTVVRHPVDRLFSAYHYLGRARVMTFDRFVTSKVPALLAANDMMVRPADHYLGDSSYAKYIDGVFRLENTTSLEAELARRFGSGFSKLPHRNSRHGKTGAVSNETSKSGRKSWWSAPRPNIRQWPRGVEIDTSRKLRASGIETIVELYRVDFERFGYPVPQSD